MKWWGALLLSVGIAAQASSYSPNLDNKASLQRGAKLYFNYCAGCHSVGYDSYQNVLDYLGVNSPEVRHNIATQAWLFDPQADISQVIQSALSPQDGQAWFGVAPPDLTTIALQKSPGWLYDFLRGFYADTSRPFGTNNTASPNTAMPNVLAVLRGEVWPVKQGIRIDHFITVKAGQLSPLEFDRQMADLVNFLAYIAEPWHQQRLIDGIAFCFLLFLLALVCHVLFKKNPNEENR